MRSKTRCPKKEEKDSVTNGNGKKEIKSYLLLLNVSLLLIYKLKEIQMNFQRAYFVLYFPQFPFSGDKIKISAFLECSDKAIIAFWPNRL